MTSQTQTEIYNHRIKEAEEFCELAQNKLCIGHLESALLCFFEASKSYERAFQIMHKCNFEKAALADENRKECINKIRELEFGKTRKEYSCLEK